MAPPPAVGTFTRRLYDRLPELYRAADEALDDGPDAYPLLRFLALLGDQADELEQLVDRIDRVRPEEGGDPGDTSDLVDPVTADAGWLDWLAQLVAVDLTGVDDVALRRALVGNANANLYDGSEAAIRAQVAPLLTGTQQVTIAPQFGTTWTVAVITLGTESAGTTPEAILEAAGRQKPAGVVLVHDAGLTWAELEANYADLDAIAATGAWHVLT